MTLRLFEPININHAADGMVMSVGRGPDLARAARGAKIEALLSEIQ